MARTCLKTLFNVVERIKEHNSCQLYLYYFAMLFQFALFFMYIFHDETFHLFDTTYTLRSTLSALMSHQTIESNREKEAENKSGDEAFEENDTYTCEIIFICVQTLFTISLILVFFLRSKDSSKSAVERAALAYASTYARLFMSGGFLLVTDLFGSYAAYMALESAESSASFAEMVLSIVMCLLYAESLLLFLPVVFLWNDVFWDSRLPWGSFGSEIPTVIQQIIAFFSAMCASNGGMPMDQAKPYLQFAFFVAGVVDLVRPFYGAVHYSSGTMYFYLALQAFATGTMPASIIAHLLGADLDLLVLMSSVLGGLALVAFAVLAVICHRDGVLNRESSKTSPAYETYFAFLMYRTIRAEGRSLSMCKFLEEHAILCDSPECTCIALKANASEDAERPDSRLDQSETRLQWFKLLGRVIDSRLADASAAPADDLWVVRHTLMLLGENNPYKCMVEIENVMEVQSYGLGTKHALYQMRRRCKALIRQQFELRGGRDDQMGARVVELFEREQEANKLKELMDSTAELALGFWRELSQKNFSVDRFQKKGNKLLQQYGEIQNRAKRLFGGMYVNNEVTISYSLFVRKVMNHAMEEMSILDSIRARINMCFDKGFLNDLYEKTATVVARANKIDGLTITSANKRIAPILGYQPHQLVGKDISCLMTRDLVKTHDRYIKRYIDSGNVNGLIRIKGISFGVRRDGFLQPLRVTIMLLPCFSDGLYFIALLQDATNDREGIWTRPNYKKQKYCFVLASRDGDILGVTKNCVERFGLAHPQFVSPNEARFKSLYKFEDIVPDILLPDVVSKLDQKEEIHTKMFTEIVAGKMDKESMQATSCTRVLQRVGVHPVLLSKERTKYNEMEQCMYKVVGMPEPTEEVLKKGALSPAQFGAAAREAVEKTVQHDDTDAGSVNSVSENSASEDSTAILTKEFKQLKTSILDKSMPRILKVVNFSVILVVLLIIVFGGVTLYYTQELITNLEKLSNCIVVSYQRRLEQAICRLQVRTIANIANGIEENVNSTRFAYMQKQLAPQLTAMAQYQNDLQHLDQDMLESNVYETANLYLTETIGTDYSFSSTMLPANVAVYDFINSALIFSTADISEIVSSFYYMQINGMAKTSVKMRYVDQMFYKVIENGYGMAGELLRNSTTEFISVSLDRMRGMQVTFDVLFYVSLGLAAVWFAILTPMIVKIHINKRDVLSVYSDLRLASLTAIISNCISYLVKSKQSSIAASEDPAEERDSSGMTGVNETAPDVQTEGKEEEKEPEEGKSAVTGAAGEEGKEMLVKPESETVGKREEFHRFDQTFAYQLGVLAFFCSGICAYFIYKYMYFTAFINDSETLVNQLECVTMTCQDVVNLVGMSKEAWMQAKLPRDSLRSNLIVYYLGDVISVMAQQRQATDNPHPAIKTSMSQTARQIDSSTLCGFVADGEEEETCRKFWNGILGYGLSQGIEAVIHYIQQNYFDLVTNLLGQTYSAKLAKSVLQSTEFYNSEAFVYSYLNPAVGKLMQAITKEMSGYFDNERNMDQIEFVVMAAVIFVLLCTLWIKLLFILDEHMWNTKAVLVLLPTEFMQQIDKNTQNFILSILGK